MEPIDTILAQLTTLTGIAVAVERTSEIAKAAYLTLKNNILKTTDTEVSKFEKETIALVVGIGTTAMLGYGIDIQGVSEPAFVQYIISGAIASLGSNVIHALITILLAIKNNIESAKTSIPTSTSATNSLTDGTASKTTGV